MVHYRAWIQSDMIGAWSNPDSARQSILEYMEANPEEAKFLSFGAFKRSHEGLQVLYSLHGEQEIKEHFDAEVE